ncbi:recombinase family protein [Neorhizobium galegae]|uniref:recombinase family protein n=1 Tax=Neorhizobium galegae TaxID=399 RepID=UPI0021054FCA|nr:recombinase family protein [Neorhizobium galegae]MCQ1766153.1 recombinase family protein [Neorhizobium galegae]MCQ1845067.1 recombinase family protein [Neorhizobium galegae]
MKHAVIYARYSTDLQNDRSVEDQIALCRSHADRLGAEVVGEYSDRAKSGASMFGRPGLASLMQAAERSEFDLLVSESPDRISRDIADLAHVHKNLKFRGVEINCVNGGAIDTVQVGMYGVIGQMQREESAKKTKRGMVGVVRSGRNAGGKSYGYEPVPGERGELQIVEAEAAVIRRVFDLYVHRVSPRAIAAALNAEGVPAPRGAQWNASTINGNDKRGHGLLRNPLYVGKRVWNRVRMIKDPTTGRRVSRENDPAEYEYSDAPHLRIVEDAVYEAARARKEAASGPRGKYAPRSRRLLTGLLRCASCGGALTTTSADRSGPRIMCSRYRESGSCENAGRYYVQKIERDVLDRLREMFADTSVIDAYVEEYRLESQRIANERRSSRAAKEAALADVQARVARVIDQISRGQIEDDDVAAIMPGLRRERDAIKADLAAEEPASNIVILKPRAIERFRQNIEQLAEIVQSKGDDLPPEFGTVFRELVSSVIVHPRKAGAEYRYEIKGKLSAIAGPELSAVSAGPMVAGGRIELPTSGL